MRNKVYEKTKIGLEICKNVLSKTLLSENRKIEEYEILILKNGDLEINILNSIKSKKDIEFLDMLLFLAFRGRSCRAEEMHYGVFCCSTYFGYELTEFRNKNFPHDREDVVVLRITKKTMSFLNTDKDLVGKRKIIFRS